MYQLASIPFPPCNIIAHFTAPITTLCFLPCFIMLSRGACLRCRQRHTESQAMYVSLLPFSTLLRLSTVQSLLSPASLETSLRIRLLKLMIYKKAVTYQICHLDLPSWNHEPPSIPLELFLSARVASGMGTMVLGPLLWSMWALPLNTSGFYHPSTGKKHGSLYQINASKVWAGVGIRAGWSPPMARPQALIQALRT